MVRHPTARRVRRQPEAPDDAFVAGVLETTAWAKKHARILIISAAVLAVLIGGFIYYRTQRGAIRASAATELTAVRQVALTGNWALAIRDLEAFLARYDGTPASREARVLLAQAYLETEQPQRTIETAERLARDPAQPLGASAAFLLAAAYEANGQVDAAERTYQRIAERGRFLFEQLDALDNIGRLRLQQEDAAGAIQAYDRAIELIPADRTQDRAIFEMRRGEALARAAGA
jgi:tetratricopeptide (TPR) repeat protein